MLKIKQIHIKNFRSIVNIMLDTEDINIFVGLNDAGKSNVLKALNLFFNSETDVGAKYNFDNDYSKLAPIRKNKAKEITISITFQIPQHYKDNDDVIWTKIWRSNGIHYDSSKEWDFSPYSKVATLLNRTRYKYVPAVKSDNYFKSLLADLYVSIASEATGELSVKATEYSSALEVFTHRIGEIVKKNVGIDSSLTMPTNQVDIFKELVFLTNDNSGKQISLSYRGDGIKAMHIPAILKYIAEHDNKLPAATAVPYTPIWGYEEPENGIEMKKCFELADELYGYTGQIQAFITTHSPGFYKLGIHENVNIYYVHKNVENYASIFSKDINMIELHDKIGIMPIVAPIIEEKQKEISRLNDCINQMAFLDKNTIFVEGITDKQYLQLAIKAFSHSLQEKIDNGELIILTREENGCGTTLLIDWAIAWMHLNYDSKAIFLLDNDKAGIDAKKKIKAAKEQYQKKNFALTVQTLHPTEDMKRINSKINNSIFYEIEHLLSYEFWMKMKKYHWADYKEKEEMIHVYNKVITMDKSIDAIIDEITDNKNMKETVLYWNPKEDKKNQIMREVCKEVEQGNLAILEGFKNTISDLEKEIIHTLR